MCEKIRKGEESLQSLLFLAQVNTFAPSAPNSSIVAFPIPFDPPVTRHVRPLMLHLFSISSFLCFASLSLLATACRSASGGDWWWWVCETSTMETYNCFSSLLSPSLSLSLSLSRAPLEDSHLKSWISPFVCHKKREEKKKREKRKREDWKKKHRKGAAKPRRSERERERERGRRRRRSGETKRKVGVRAR